MVSNRQSAETSNYGKNMRALPKQTVLMGLSAWILLSCSGGFQGSSASENQTQTSFTPTTEDSADLFRREFEQDEGTFRTKLFEGAFFPSAEVVSNLVSAEGLYSQIVEGEPNRRIQGLNRSVCDSLAVEDLVSLAKPSRASSIYYSYDREKEMPDNVLLFEAEAVVFDVPRQTSLQSLARSAIDSVALNGGECTTLAKFWKICKAALDPTVEAAIPGWIQETDMLTAGCERSSRGQELTTTVDRVPDLYFPNQFLILQTPTAASEYRMVNAYWFLPAEWIGVMFYIETRLVLNVGKPFRSSSPTASEVIDAASGVFKSFKDQLVKGLSNRTELPSYEDLFVRRTGLDASG
jgi:hypothetical protein